MHLFLIQTSMLLLICFIHALTVGHNIEFSPINDAFQNFNPVRRFLKGQIVYRDFNDYLGLGHSYLDSLLYLCSDAPLIQALLHFLF